MFNSIMMNQLGVKPKTLRQDILDNLNASEKPVTNIELGQRSKVWCNQRDVSCELVRMKAAGLVVIADYDRSTYPPRGLWQLTDAGRAVAVSEEELEAA